MKKVFRGILLVSFVLVLVFSLVACGGKTVPEKEIDADEGTKRVEQLSTAMGEKIQKQLEEEGLGIEASGELKITSNQKALKEISGNPLKADMKAAITKDKKTSFVLNGSYLEDSIKLFKDSEYFYLNKNVNKVEEKAKVKVETLNEFLTGILASKGVTTISKPESQEEQQAQMIIEDFKNQLDFSKVYTTKTRWEDGVEYYSFALNKDGIKYVIDKFFEYGAEMRTFIKTSMENGTYKTDLKAAFFTQILFDKYSQDPDGDGTVDVSLNLELNEWVEQVKLSEYKILTNLDEKIQASQLILNASFANVNKFNIFYEIGFKKDYIASLVFNFSIDLNVPSKGDETKVEPLTMDIAFKANMDIKNKDKVKLVYPEDKNAYEEKTDVVSFG